MALLLLLKILFNASTLNTGGGLFTGLSVLHGWLQEKNIEIHALLTPAFLRELGTAKNKLTHLEVVPASPGSSLPAGRAFRRQATAFEEAVKPDAVFTVFGPSRWRPRAPHLCGFANGLYLPAQKAQPYRGRATTFEKALHLLKRAAVFQSLSHDTDRLWVETESCKMQLGLLLPRKKVALVSNELHPAFHAFLPPPKKPGGIFNLLFPAAGYPHKNFSLLRALLQSLPAETHFRFLVTLPVTDFETFFKETVSHPALYNLGPLPPEKLLSHYQAADAVFQPSIAEIFSATWLEAFAVQRPLLCADIPAAREICGEAALYFDGHSVPAALTALEQLADDSDLQQQLTAAGTQQLAHFTKGSSRATQLLLLLKQMISKTNAAL